MDRFTEGLTVLSSRQLGPTRSVTIYGEMDDNRLRLARAAGLEIGPITLQDLFVHLTEAERIPV